MSRTKRPAPQPIFTLTQIQRAEYLSRKGSPSSPSRVSAAQKCNRSLVRALQKGIGNTQKALGGCELGNISAASPVDCSSTLATTIASQEATVDASVGKCAVTTDLLACPFVAPADPACLGDAMTTMASELVGVVFAQE